MLRLVGNRHTCFSKRHYQSINASFHSNRSHWLDTVHKDHLRQLLDNNGALVVDNEQDMKVYNQDWLGKWRGTSDFAVRPKTTDQVSSIVKYCNENRIGIVPQGGNTGLVAGSIPSQSRSEGKNQIVLSLSLMNQIIHFDEKSGTLVCQSGCILENLNNFLDRHGYMMPIDLGAKGSCQIGGNLATAAGGVRYIRYKSLHANTLGMEIVLPDGTIVNALKTIRKDNTGYHFPHLFIGSEGTLGIITKVSIATVLKPKSVNVVLLTAETFDDVCKIFRVAKEFLGEILSAYEFFDKDSMNLVVRHGLVNPLEQSSKFFVLLETHGSNSEHDEQKLSHFFEHVLDNGSATDGTIATDESQRLALWKLREGIPEFLRVEGYVYKYDVSIPLAHMYEIVEILRQKFLNYETLKNVNVYGFGHLGDDNLHLNFVLPAKNDQAENEIEPFIYEWTKKYHGSISAEHGIGTVKKKYLHYSQTPESIELMRRLKRALDPNNIMNPGKIIDI